MASRGPPSAACSGAEGGGGLQTTFRANAGRRRHLGRLWPASRSATGRSPEHVWIRERCSGLPGSGLFAVKQIGDVDESHRTRCPGCRFRGHSPFTRHGAPKPPPVVPSGAYRGSDLTGRPYNYQRRAASEQPRPRCAHCSRAAHLKLLRGPGSLRLADAGRDGIAAATAGLPQSAPRIWAPIPGRLTGNRPRGLWPAPKRAKRRTHGLLRPHGLLPCPLRMACAGPRGWHAPAAPPAMHSRLAEIGRLR